VTARGHLDSQQGRVRVTDGAGRRRDIVLHGAMRAWCRTTQAHRHAHRLLCATFPSSETSCNCAPEVGPASASPPSREPRPQISQTLEAPATYTTRVRSWRDEAGSPTPLCGEKLQQRRARCISAHRLRWAGPGRTRRRPCGRRRPAGGACVPARVADLRCAHHPPSSGVASAACAAAEADIGLAPAQDILKAAGGGL
jgi:hypothetical protein